MSIDFKYSTNGYWVTPEGEIHAMPEYQIHREWVFERHGEEWGIERRLADTEAMIRGWVSITFGMNRVGFSIEFREHEVAKKAIASTRHILKEHDPDDAVHINDCLGFKDGYYPWRKAYIALREFPKKREPLPKLVAPRRGLSKRMNSSVCNTEPGNE